MQFSQDFNKPIDNIQFREGDLNHFAVIDKTRTGYEIVIDKKLAMTLNHEQLKTLVYHMTAVAVGMKPNDTKGHFLNQKCILRKYKNLKHDI